MSNGGTSGQHEERNYSALNASEMPTLEYGNIGQSSTTTNTSSELGNSSHNSNARNYTNIAPHQTEPNPYEELPAGAASSPAQSQSDHDNRTASEGAASKGSSYVQNYDTPVKRCKDYQPLIPGERSSYGEYTQASPCHKRSAYDVPRKQSTNNPLTQQQQSPAEPLMHNEVDNEKKYVNTTDPEGLDDMYVEMASAPREE